MDNQHLTISKILIGLGVIICLYIMVPKIQKTYTTYVDLQAKIQDLNNKNTQIDNIQKKKAEYEMTEKTSTKPVYKNEVEVTDRMSSFGVMFEDVIQAAKYNGLKLRSIEYNENPAEDPVQTSMAGEYNVCAIKMQLIGSYMQFRSYFQDIYNYPYVINLDKISIKPYEKNKKVLISDVVVTLYSAKSQAQREEYLAAQAAAESANEGDKKSSSSGITVAPPNM